jgi:hypothetical protein
MKALLAATLALAAGCSFSSPDGTGPKGAETEPDAGLEVDAGAPQVDAAPGARCAAYTYSYQGHKYRLGSGTGSGITWAKAKESCESDGGYLLKIETSGEDQQVEDAFIGGPQEVWIGLSDLNRDGNYFWTDGTPASAFSHWNQAPAQASPDCVVKNTYTLDGRWYARDCGLGRAVICECVP